MPSVGYDPQRDVDVDLFALLGTDWGADPETVRRAWRRASRAAHPDAGGSHETFIRMQHAWEVLSDPGHRTRYIRAYEARHGPQGRRAGSRARSGGGGGPRRTGRPRTSTGRPPPRPPRWCTGTNRNGLPCANPAVPGSDRCRWHDRAFDTGGSTGRAGASGRAERRADWQCTASVSFRGTQLRCLYNRLIGETRCWDHADEAGRQAAIARAGEGRCSAVTQSGRSCRNPRSRLGFPLCDTHLTVGVFRTYDRGGPSGGGGARARAPQDPPPAAQSPPTPPPPPPDAAAPPPQPSPPPRRAAPHARTTASSRSADSPSPRAPWERPTPPPRPPQEPPPTRGRHPHHVIAVVVAATASVALVAAGFAGAVYRLTRPDHVHFAADIKATSASCQSATPIRAEHLAFGFDLTCTMIDGAPGNRDRPYVQVRLEGCDDWQRLDHDDGPDPVAVTTRVEPCGTVPDALHWQVCQTHGGPFPDDCHDGSTDLPPT